MAQSRSNRSSRVRFERYVDDRRAATHLESVGANIDTANEKKKNKGPKRSAKGLIIAFWRLLAGHRLTIAMSLATLSVSVAFALVMPMTTKVALDYVLTDSPGPSGLPDALSDLSRVQLLWVVGGVMLGAALLGAAFSMWGRWQCTRITKRVQVALRKRVFDHASNLPLHRIQAIKAGGVSSILREDAGGVGDLVFTLLYNPWRALTQLAGTLIVIIWIDWVLVVGAIAVLPVIWVSHRTWIARIRPMYRDIRHTRQTIDAQSAETFGGMRVVRGFNRRLAEAARFTREGHFMARQELRTWWWSRMLEVVWQILIPLASVIVLLYGGSRVLQGDLTIGDLMAFSAYLLMLLGPLEALVASATNVQNNLAALDRVQDLLDENREFASQTQRDRIDRSKVRGRITLDGVWFAYPTRAAKKDLGADLADSALGDTNMDEDTSPGKMISKTVISHFTLDVAAGETIAFVGPSGAGKTTLCNLIARFYDPTQGRVLLDGVDLQTLDVDDFRRMLGIVEQDVFLFDGSVTDNIGYARRDATENEIFAAARAANAHGFITELEKGYETLVGERGVRLSGGQKQRIAIARAILADPKVLILDEATSNLDTESERLIQRSLGELMRHRTSFVIAHRLSTIRHADRIVVIEDGMIVEQGTHEELLRAGGRYSDVLSMQLEGDGTSSMSEAVS